MRVTIPMTARCRYRCNRSFLVVLCADHAVDGRRSLRAKSASRWSRREQLARDSSRRCSASGVRRRRRARAFLLTDADILEIGVELRLLHHRPAFCARIQRMSTSRGEALGHPANRSGASGDHALRRRAIAGRRKVPPWSVRSPRRQVRIVPEPRILLPLELELRQRETAFCAIAARSCIDPLKGARRRRVFPRLATTDPMSLTRLNTPAGTPWRLGCR